MVDIPQTDPYANYCAHKAAIDGAITRVLDSGRYIMGEEVSSFEKEFAEYVGVNYAAGVASGTDALELALRACGVGADTIVFTVSHTAVATVAAIERTGAQAILIDIDPDTYNMDANCLETAISKSYNGRAMAIVPVHIYGHPADMESIRKIADNNELFVIEDCAQAHGASKDDWGVGTWGHMSAFSFYPTKNLGALGDGGAACTNDAGLAERIRSLRNGGMSKTSHHEHTGINSRLDELHAAVLRAKLPFLSAWTTKRRRLAARYREQLCGQTITLLPEIDPGHVYHLFPIKTTHRESLRKHLSSFGIDTVVHYPTPLPEQPAFKRDAAGMCPIAEHICGEIVSLPLHPALPDESIDRVIQSVIDFAR